ncbi:hypothetical protein [Leekyejoonella antrihumi]|uniref:Fis family transcriptional regulator n=1 Tax=Leekyejoonella antrihumi TaxID=1660198 RepID=A0A563DXX6_9MICO|nr:hypothetical protein [Leekyejoonella antrihumi]TWP35110.1 hypothetical protein FGL98_15285 [Leekyejoonella antrihumi]
MRWQELFMDLEAQLVAAERQELDAQVAERTRIERSAVHWLDRAAVSVGLDLAVTTPGGPVRGRLEDLGKDWLLLDEPGRRGALVPTAAVTSVVGLAVRSDDDCGLGRRFGLGSALRAISRDRAPVVVHDIAGGLATGTIDRVGADHLELAEHPADAVRRGSAVTGRRIVPFAAIAATRRA